MEVVDLEKASLNQHYKHFEGKIDKDGKVYIGSDFWDEQEPMTKYKLIYSKMESTVSGGGIKYNFHPGSDVIIKTKLFQRINGLELKDEYKEDFRIRWCKNLLHNIINKAEAKTREMNLPGLDTVTLDIIYQYIYSGDKKIKYERSIGNIPELREWNNYLPSVVLGSVQLWFYSQFTESYFHNFYLEERGEEFYHIYNFNNDIRNLLQIEKRDDEGYWKPYTIEPHYFYEWPENGKLDIPDLYSTVASLSEEEKNQYIECGFKRKFFYHDYINFDIENLSTGEISSKLISSNYIAKCIFWAAYNETGGQANRKSNYTTEELDENGTDPFCSHTFTYGTLVKFENLGSEHFKNHDSDFPGCPDDEFLAYPFVIEPFKYGVDPGIVFYGSSDFTFICDIGSKKEKLKFMSGEIKLHNDDDVILRVGKNKYKIHIRLMVVKEYQISRKYGIVDIKLNNTKYENESSGDSFDE